MNRESLRLALIFLFSLLLLSFSNAQTPFQTAQVDTQNGFYLHEAFEQTWDGADWADDWKCTYSYDANHNCTEELAQVWDGVEWVNDEKSTFTYNINGNCIEELQQNWDEVLWLDNHKNTFTYDENGNIPEELNQRWRQSNWVNSFLPH